MIPGSAMMISLMQWNRLRRARKRAREALQHAKHLRRMREDILTSAQLNDVAEAERRIRDALRSGAGAEPLDAASELLYEALGRAAPPRRAAGLREHAEVLVVAVAVAMAFRTYFLQPFKIPTGSMQPTLYGIHSREDDNPGIADRVLPLKVAKWMITGEWYKRVTVEVPGEYKGIRFLSDDPSVAIAQVGPIQYKLPRDARPRFRPGAYLEYGTLLWAGYVTAGDHVFVDRVRWNFTRPKRGSVMVFTTDGITALPQGTHYIKRMAGVPGDRLRIDAPFLVVNERPLLHPDKFRMISEKVPPHDVPPYNRGYIPPEGPEASYLLTPADEVALGPDEYWALGDNTGNSRDSRYWGPVPRGNLVGPGAIVYWPVSSRWGLIQ